MKIIILNVHVDVINGSDVIIFSFKKKKKHTTIIITRFYRNARRDGALGTRFQNLERDSTTDCT